jgi:hypothetical protein
MPVVALCGRARPRRGPRTPRPQQPACLPYARRPEPRAPPVTDPAGEPNRDNGDIGPADFVEARPGPGPGREGRKTC